MPALSKATSLNANVSEVYQHAFHWTDSFKNALPSKDLQKVSLAIDDGFPDVRLAPIDQLMREYRSISRKFYGKKLFTLWQLNGIGAAAAFGQQLSF